jgi:hypothetical protein
MGAAASGLLIGTAWRMAKPMRAHPQPRGGRSDMCRDHGCCPRPLLAVLLVALPITLWVHDVFRRGRLTCAVSRSAC